AKDHLALFLLALRCFLLALFPNLDLVLSRIPVKFSSPIRLLGLAISLLIWWFISTINRLSLPDKAISLRFAERVSLR
ncbi:MAG: hypothetical protein ACYTXY_48540, partial [Nostoc sp.]